MYKALINKSLAVIAAVFVMFVTLLVLSPKANAEVFNAENGQKVTNGHAPVNCQTSDSFGNGIWGVNGTVTVKLTDINGNNAGFASSYTVKIVSQDVQTGNGGGGIGVGYNPGTGQGTRLNSATVKVNDTNRKNGCTLFDGTTYYPLVIDSGYTNAQNPQPIFSGSTQVVGTDDLSLDCWYAGNGNSRNRFIFSLESVDMPGWQYGYWTVSQGTNVLEQQSGSSADLNDSSFNLTFEFHQTAPPRSTISTQKYFPPDHALSVTAPPAIPAAVAGAKVYYGNNDPQYDGNGDEGFDRGTSNPFVNNNIWLNPSDPNSPFPGDYKVWVEVPAGYKVTGGAMDIIGTGRNNSPPISCGSWNGKNICTMTGVRVNGISARTTYVDFFFARDIRGSLDQACGINQQGVKIAKNHTVTGWAYDPAVPNNHASFVDVKIYNGADQEIEGHRVLANQPRPDVVAAGQAPDPNHGYTQDLDQKYFDANPTLYKVRAFPLVPINPNGNLDDPNNWQGSGVTLGPLGFRCPGSTGNVDTISPTCEIGNALVGWGVDGQDEAKSPTFHIYIDGKFATAITADTPRPDVVTYLKDQGYPGPLEPGGKYGFNIADLSKILPSSVYDGNPHTMNVYLITKNGTNPSLYTGPAGSQTNSFKITCPVQLRPWLQTYNGDVIANGQVVGQPQGQPGSRATNEPNKEAEYLIISAVGGAGPFCSTTNYILTNEQATNGNCQNSTGSGGYRINGQGLGGSGADKVLAAIKKAWDANGAGNPGGGSNAKCNPYNTQTSSNLEGISSTQPVRLATGFGASACINGTIIKLNSNKLGNIAVDSGRITIWVTADQLAGSGGKLTIDNNIVYNYTPGYDDARKVPNLAIIVEGDVNIDSNNILSGTGVSQLDAAIYATGKINTCPQFDSVVRTNPPNTSPNNCNKGLIVHGMLAGKNGFSFTRTFTNNGSNPPPAEQVMLTGQTVAFPPPGFDNLYFGDFDSSSQIDTGELQPRF